MPEAMRSRFREMSTEELAVLDIALFLYGYDKKGRKSESPLRMIARRLANEAHDVLAERVFAHA